MSVTALSAADPGCVFPWAKLMPLEPYDEFLSFHSSWRYLRTFFWATFVQAIAALMMGVFSFNARFR